MPSSCAPSVVITNDGNPRSGSGPIIGDQAPVAPSISGIVCSSPSDGSREAAEAVAGDRVPGMDSIIGGGLNNGVGDARITAAASANMKRKPSAFSNLTRGASLPRDPNWHSSAQLRMSSNPETILSLTASFHQAAVSTAPSLAVPSHDPRGRVLLVGQSDAERLTDPKGHDRSLETAPWVMGTGVPTTIARPQAKRTNDGVVNWTSSLAVIPTNDSLAKRPAKAASSRQEEKGRRGLPFAQTSIPPEGGGEEGQKTRRAREATKIVKPATKVSHSGAKTSKYIGVSKHRRSGR